MKYKNHIGFKNSHKILKGKNMKNIFSKTSMLGLFVFLFFWALLISTTEIGLNNIKSFFTFIPSEYRHVAEMLSEDEKTEYQKTDMNEELEDIREMLLMEHQKEDSILSDFLSQDTIRDLDILHHIDILGFFFINKYPIELTQKSDYRNISYHRDMNSYGDIGYNFFTDSGQKLHDIVIDHSAIMHEVAERYRDPASIPFVYEEVLKIGTSNEDLIDRIKSVVYKEYINDVSYVYGYGFILLYLLFFTLFAWALEVRYALVSLPKGEYERFNISSITENSKRLSKFAFFRTQPAFTICIVFGTIVALLMLGFLSSMFELYVSNFDSVRSIGLFYYLVNPLNDIAHFVGVNYINNIPLSRFVLLFFMPMSLILYMQVISSIDDIVKEHNKIKTIGY